MVIESHMTLALQHPERLWLVAAILAVAAVVLLWGYWKSPLRGFTKLAAVSCKLGAWGLLLFCLTDPVWSRKQPKTGENEVVIVADNSASLQVAETSGGVTRGESMREALGKDPREDIARSAGRERHHEAHRALRPLRRLRPRGPRKRGGGGKCEEIAAIHACSPFKVASPRTRCGPWEILQLLHKPG